MRFLIDEPLSSWQTTHYFVMELGGMICILAVNTPNPNREGWQVLHDTNT